MQGFQIGKGFYSDEQPLNDGSDTAAPLILKGANGEPATHIDSRETLIAIMKSPRYKSDPAYQRAVVELIANSDAVELGLAQPESETNPLLEAAYRDAKESYVKTVFGGDYSTNPATRYAVMRQIATQPDMANQLAEGRVIEHGEGMSVVINSDKPSNSANAPSNSSSDQQ